MLSVSLFTPTHASDFERFCLQRESIETCEIDIPHVAVVNHEDVALFKRTPHQRGLTILSAREVLPPAYDRRRAVWRISRRDYRYWITGRGIHGWLLQQLLKLASPAVVRTDGIICLDSDVFFVDQVTASDFIAPDGRLHLYETTDDIDAEMAEWYAHSLRFLSQKVTSAPLRRFTHAPVPMLRELLVELQQFIEEQRGRPWMEAIIQADRVMEYTTYGVYARHIDKLSRVCPIKPSLAHYYWWAHEAQNIEDHFADQIASSKPKMILINSNIGLDVGVCRRLLLPIWESQGGRKARNHDV
jgi:hypothetical protein